MEFSDSYFEPSTDDISTVDQKDRVSYKAKTCELGWFMIPNLPFISKENGSIHDMNFVTLKYRADLLYYHKDYNKAAMAYSILLTWVPKSNACVTRELRDALVRCHLRLGKGELAKQDAEKMVLPPHEKDWSSWKLLADCYEMLQDYEAQVMSLQRSVSLQRCHSRFWVSLSAGYKKLGMQSWASKFRSVTSNEVPNGSSSSSDAAVERLRVILERTVQLFRPYLSWRRHVGKEEHVTSEYRLGDNSKMSSDSEATVSSGTSERECCTVACTTDCVFYDELNEDKLKEDVSFSSVITGATVDGSSESVPSLCYDHSPFVMLVKQLLSPEELIKTVIQCTQSLPGVADHLVNSVYVMAECSCLVWARQVLLYSVRYSHSFPKECLQSDLSKVEGLLEDCNQEIRTYIIQHFSKRTVFDDDVK